MMEQRNLKLVDGAGPVDSHSFTENSSALGGGNSALARAGAILPLELVDVCFSPGGEVLLREINLSFAGDGVSVILGPNGAGKTLLLRICHGLLTPTTGQVRWRDMALALQPASQGMVFQKPVVLRRSVEDNIRFALRVNHIRRDEHDGRVSQALEASGLKAIAGRRATHLSGGEQQRLAMARCLAVRPRVLFLDEPTAHLDPAATHKIEEMIQLIRDAGARVIMVTHDIGQAKRLAKEIIFMHRGRILECAAAEQFFQQPRSREAAAYLAGELLW